MSPYAVGLMLLTFNLISLLLGYNLSRWAGLNKSIATAISFETGIHNSTTIVYVALSVLRRKTNPGSLAL